MNPALPQDPALPQLASALDASAMAQVFADLLAGTGATLLRCHVDRVKYRAQRNLSVAYVLDLQDARGPYTQRVAARLCTGGDSARRHAKAAAKPLLASRAGPSFSHVPALDLSAHWWPNDAKLAAGAVLADADALQQRWLPEVADALDAGPCIGHRLELVQLVPEHRVTARVDLHLAHGSDAQTRIVYAKADAETRGPVTQAVMASLWQSPARREGRLALPRPLLWQPGSGLHWQAAVRGHALLDARPVPDATCAAAVGRLLAALHQSPAPAAPCVSLDGLRLQLLETHKLLCAVQPALAARAGRVAAQLEAGLSHISSGAQILSTLHGDLHPRNLMIDGEDLSLIDLDSARQGPALLDLGAWLADAIYRAQLDGRRDDGTGAGRSGFLSGYMLGGGQHFGARSIAWATAWQLWCQRVWRCIVNLKPGRYALVPGLLTQIEALLALREVPMRAPQEWVA
jgi:aminoglycoside phosphotransferase